MRFWRPILIALGLATVMTFFTCPALAQDANPPDRSALSPYWARAVTRWDPIIMRYSLAHGLDPDFVAAVIWKESLGRPTAHSPAGAVGLMMLMPFPWRPSPEELENPWTNVGWGTHTLVEIIGDGRGDLYYSLAAYNGSWEKVDQRNTRRYATSVLDHYSRAIAVEFGLPVDGDWTAIFAVEGGQGPGTVTVLGPQRPLARYTERLWQADLPCVPQDVAPHATVVTFVDEHGAECRVNVWLVAPDGSPLISAPESTSSGGTVLSNAAFGLPISNLIGLY